MYQKAVHTREPYNPHRRAEGTNFVMIWVLFNCHHVLEYFVSLGRGLHKVNHTFHLLQCILHLMKSRILSFTTKFRLCPKQYVHNAFGFSSNLGLQAIILPAHVGSAVVPLSTHILKGQVQELQSFF